MISAVIAKTVIVGTLALSAHAGGHVTVAPGDTPSGIAASNGVSLTQVESANPQITNPNVITVGEVVNLTGGSGSVGSQPASGDGVFGHPFTCGDGDGDGWDIPCSQLPGETTSPGVGSYASTDGSAGAQSTPAQQSSGEQASQAVPNQSQVRQGSAPTSAPSRISIPGMPQSLANCIWFRESTDGTNPAANGNQFGIIRASGHNVAGMSVAQQEQVAGQIYASVGGRAWSADGCPGT